MKDIKEKTAWEVIKDIPARLLRLIWKLLSRKGIVLALTVWLIKSDTFPEGSVLFGIEGLKFLKDLKK